MAEVEITVKEADDLLREINNQGDNVATASSSEEEPDLRPRGSSDSVAARTRYPFELTKAFNNCQACATPLQGCVEGRIRAGSTWSHVVTCGHVICGNCKDACRRTHQEHSTEPPLYECPVCKEYGAVNKVPGSESVNHKSCSTAYCSGEEWGPPLKKCTECQKAICEDCLPLHAERFPGHVLSPRLTTTVSHKRAFTGCATHQETVTARCDCGEMVCELCPSNYISHIPGTTRVQEHRTTKMETADLALEDALDDTLSTVSTIRDMRQLAAQKREELEEATDRVANEVALHFNHVIVQAIERCFDVLTGLKKLGSTHHSAIERHLKRLDKTERQLIMGVEMDERARSRSSVRADSVAQYVRNVAYGLCKPALEQFEESREFSSRLEATQFDVVFNSPDTHEIVDKIGRWGETVLVNDGDDPSLPLKESRIAPSEIRPAASVVDGVVVEEYPTDAPIAASTLPLRLHTALEHFTDLYERRFHPELMAAEVSPDHKRELPFQLGERDAPEGRMSRDEIEARYAYERLMLCRPGMFLMQPKIFGGFECIYNLKRRKEILQYKDVQTAYRQTPRLAPIWMSNGDNPTEITPLRATRDEQMQQDDPAAAAASPSATEGSSPPSSGTQQQKPKVVRQGQLVFVKKVPEQQPPLLQAEVPQPPPPPPRPSLQQQQAQQWRPSYGTPAPSRALPPTILRRQQQPTSLLDAVAPVAFRAATNAERAAVGVGAAAAAAAARKRPQVLLTDPADQSGGKRLFRLVGSPQMGGGLNSPARVVRDSNGSMRTFRNDYPSPHHSGPRPILRPPGQYGTSGQYGAGTSGSSGRAAGGMDFNQDESDGMRPTYRVNSVRMAGTVENRYGNTNMFKSPMDRPRYVSDTPEEGARRTKLRDQGFSDVEINKIFDRERTKDSTSPSMANMKVIVPTNRNAVYGMNSNNRPHFAAPQNYNNRMGGGMPPMKKRMLPIERAFTRMFGEDGSLVPSFPCRRRGRPPKDDPTAPSNIIETFRRTAAQWPPKFDEMNEEEIAELQDLIDQLNAANREEEEGERPLPLFNNGVKYEDDELVSPWQSYTAQEREQIKQAAQEKLQSVKQGCFVCQLFRGQGGYPKNWQCDECLNMGRPLTPVMDDGRESYEEETADVPQKKKRSTRETREREAEEEMEEMEHEEEDEDGEEEGEQIDLAALLKDTLPVAPRVERRGRPRKNRAPEEAQPAKRTPQPRETKKKRESAAAAAAAAIEEHVESQEDGVVGTTRRGRQIKMPAKLKGHEVNTASTTTSNKRSPSVASEAQSEYSSPAAAAALPTTTQTTPSTATRASPTKRKAEEIRQIKEETPEAEPRSAMDVPKRGGRRRY